MKKEVKLYFETLLDRYNLLKNVDTMTQSYDNNFENEYKITFRTSKDDCFYMIFNKDYDIKETGTTFSNQIFTDETFDLLEQLYLLRRDYRER